MTKRKKILFYFSGNQQSIDLTSLMIALKQEGFEILFLTSCEKGVLHCTLEKHEIQTYSKVYTKNRLFYIKHILYLVKFVKKHHIDIVYSHIQVNNFIASLAQYLCSAQFFMCRHHSDYVWNGNNKTEKLFDKAINRLSKHIVIISDKSYHQIKNVEQVNKDKLHRINLGYDFSLYSKENRKKIQQIKEQFNTSFLLVNIGRMIPLKRQELLIKSCAILQQNDIDFKLLLLGDGILREHLEKLIHALNLSKNVFIIGHVENVMDYLSASDLLVHTSNSEASSTVAKEAGLTKTPVLVCEDVGDFEDYIDNTVGYLIPKEITPEELSNKLMYIYQEKNKLPSKGLLLEEKVKTMFDIENIIPKYKNLFN